MTYKTFLITRFKGDKTDLAFGVASGVSLLTIILIITSILSVAEHSFMPVLGGLAYFAGIVAGFTLLFFMSTYIYWFIAERK